MPTNMTADDIHPLGKSTAYGVESASYRSGRSPTGHTQARLAGLICLGRIVRILGRPDLKCDVTAVNPSYESDGLGLCSCCCVEAHFACSWETSDSILSASRACGSVTFV